MKHLFGALLGAVLLPSASFAADEAFIDESRFGWEGTYIGAQIGALDVEDDFSDPAFGAPVNLTVGTAEDDGFQFGIHGGHNWVNENFLFGVVADINLTDIDAVGAANPLFGVFGRAEMNWQASLRARLGMIKDDVLFYATGGVAVADFDLDFAFPGPFFNFGDQFSDTLTGYTVGAGIEFAISEGVTAKVEYLYSDYGDADGTIINCCAPPPDFQRHELTSNTINFGISKKLN
ncbi:MAG: porin family protein [Rhizobiaceae bacterium]|nr:porin family protein [Rhizobiaceae bacterium]